MLINQHTLLFANPEQVLSEFTFLKKIFMLTWGLIVLVVDVDLQCQPIQSCSDFSIKDERLFLILTFSLLGLTLVKPNISHSIWLTSSLKRHQWSSINNVTTLWGRGSMILLQQGLRRLEDVVLNSVTMRAYLSNIVWRHLWTTSKLVYFNNYLVTNQRLKFYRLTWIS